MRAGDDAFDFQELFDTAPCGFIVADGDGARLRANHSFAAWIGQIHFAPTLRMRGRLDEIALEPVLRPGRGGAALDFT